jgi:rhodanese-related sulfurtransferase
MSALKTFDYIFTIILFLFFTNFVFSDNEEIPLDSKDSQIIKKISVQQAREMIEANKGNNKFMILDLRTAEEHKLERIENSNNIDFFSENFRKDLNKLDKNKTYIIHCHSGRRAEKTVPIIKELGFKEVYNMGGIVRWIEAGFKIVKTD